MNRRRKRRFWTAEHLRALQALARRKVPAAKIARTLKRTEGAIRQKAFSIGLSLESRLGGERRKPRNETVSADSVQLSCLRNAI